MKKLILGLAAASLALSGCGRISHLIRPEKEQITEKSDFPVTEYEIVGDSVYDFDNTPSDDPFNDFGYIIQQDGYFGFMDTNGEYVMYPDYKGLMMQGSSQDPYDKIWFFREDGWGEKLAYYLGYTDTMEVPIFGFAQAPHIEFLDADNHLKTCTMTVGPDYGSEVFDFETYYPNPYTILVPKIEQEITCMEDFDSIDFSSLDYYIVTDENEMFGPYSHNEYPYYDPCYLEENSMRFDIYDLVYGMFYERENGQYRIYAKDGKDSFDVLVDAAKPISYVAVKFKKDGKMGVVDQNLNVVLYGDFDDVTRPINGRAYVKMDGSWKLIEIKD